MLSWFFVTLGFATIGAHAEPTVCAVGGLEISLSSPANKVASASDLRVVAIVRNAGDEDLKILKFGTALDDEHPTRAFIISRDGKEVPVIGTTVCVPAFSVIPNIYVDGPIGSGPYGQPLRE